MTHFAKQNYKNSCRLSNINETLANKATVAIYHGLCIALAATAMVNKKSQRDESLKIDIDDYVHDFHCCAKYDGNRIGPS